ncbi:MAG: type II toxin-antitoxin system PemK/MazF family toxin [Candidatus Paceibacterota bacterium]|jgi:mRNA-degrading endonuclease toxin of MazEF toxin-antitoxin module
MNEIIKEILKIFVSWTKLKVKIHLSEREVYPKIRGIWWVSLGQNIGVETNGKNDKFERPVVVIKVFNNSSVLVAPISSIVKENKYCIKFINEDKEENIIKMSQIRSISTKRFVRYVGELKIDDFEKVKRVYLSFV